MHAYARKWTTVVGTVAVSAVGAFLSLLAAFTPPAGASHSYPATYHGSVAGGGMLDFDVSADGLSITRYAVAGVDPGACQDWPLELSAKYSIQIPWTESHGFSTSLSGTFDAPQHATGTFSVVLGPADALCTTPTVNWTATTSAPPGPARWPTCTPPVTVPPVPFPGDNVPPDTMITKGAPDRTHKAAVKFGFMSYDPGEGAGSAFEYKLDNRAWKVSTCPRKVRRLERGPHVFQVRAIDAAGNVDQTPAKDRFKVIG